MATGPLSSRSKYWVEKDDGVMVSTDLQFMKTMLGRELKLSAHGLSSWLSGYPNPAISLFEEINVLPIGYKLELSISNRAKIIKFWDIDPENKTILDNQADYSVGFLNFKFSAQNAFSPSTPSHPRLLTMLHLIKPLVN